MFVILVPLAFFFAILKALLVFALLLAAIIVHGIVAIWPIIVAILVLALPFLVISKIREARQKHLYETVVPSRLERERIEGFRREAEAQQKQALEARETWLAEARDQYPRLMAYRDQHPEHAQLVDDELWRHKIEADVAKLTQPMNDLQVVTLIVLGGVIMLLLLFAAIVH